MESIFDNHSDLNDSIIGHVIYAVSKGVAEY